MADKLQDIKENKEHGGTGRPSSKKGELTLVFFQAALQSDDISRFDSQLLITDVVEKTQKFVFITTISSDLFKHLNISTHQYLSML